MPNFLYHTVYCLFFPFIIVLFFNHNWRNYSQRGRRFSVWIKCYERFRITHR